MNSVRTRENTAEYRIVSDRWGDPLDRADADDRAAVARLASALVDETGFVAHEPEYGYGLLVEFELPWSRSDDVDTVVGFWRHDMSDVAVLAVAVNVVDHVVAELAAAGCTAHGSIAHGPDVVEGRVAARIFVPENMLPLSPELRRVLVDIHLHVFADPF